VRNTLEAASFGPMRRSRRFVVLDVAMAAPAATKAPAALHGIKIYHFQHVSLVFNTKS
jgi:hypothetical protein